MNRRVAAIAALALLQAGCPTFANDNYVYREGFQSCPTGCGWERVSGAAGDVTIGETLPGERGLHLRGDVAVTHALMVVPSASFQAGPSNFALDLIARCDLGSELQVQISATTNMGEPQAFQPLAQTSQTWTGRRPPLEIFPSGVFPEPVISSLDNILILKTGPGVCEIDEVGIFFDDPFRFTE